MGFLLILSIPAYMFSDTAYVYNDIKNPNILGIRKNKNRYFAEF